MYQRTIISRYGNTVTAGSEAEFNREVQRWYRAYYKGFMSYSYWGAS